MRNRAAGVTRTGMRGGEKLNEREEVRYMEYGCSHFYENIVKSWQKIGKMLPEPG